MDRVGQKRGDPALHGAVLAALVFLHIKASLTHIGWIAAVEAA